MRFFIGTSLNSFAKSFVVFLLLFFIFTVWLISQISYFGFFVITGIVILYILDHRKKG